MAGGLGNHRAKARTVLLAGINHDWGRRYPPLRRGDEYGRHPAQQYWG